MSQAIVGELTNWKGAVLSLLAELAPRVAAAVCIALLAWMLALLTRWLARRVASFLWIDRLLLRSEMLSGLIEPARIWTPRLISGVLYWSILAAGALSAVSILNESAGRYLATLVLVYFPKLVLMTAILLVSWWAARYCGRSTLIWMTNEGITRPWRWSALVRLAVMLSGIALASEATGFATLLIRSAFLIILAGLTVLVTLAALPAVRAHLEIFLSPGRDTNPDPSDDRLWR